MFQKTSFTTLIVGVFVVYVLHTCWVMYGIVYTKPCENPKFENCINPYLAGKPRLQVGMHHCKLARWNENLPVRQLFWVWKHLLCFFYSPFPAEYLHSLATQCWWGTHPHSQGGGLWCWDQVWKVQHVLRWQDMVVSISQSVVISTMITYENFVVDTVSDLWVFAGWLGLHISKSSVTKTSADICPHS